MVFLFLAGIWEGCAGVYPAAAGSTRRAAAAVHALPHAVPGRRARPARIHAGAASRPGVPPDLDQQGPVHWVEPCRAPKRARLLPRFPPGTQSICKRCAKNVGKVRRGGKGGALYSATECARFLAVVMLSTWKRR
jgi:hypothetical protein